MQESISKGSTENNGTAPGEGPREYRLKPNGLEHQIIKSKPNGLYLRSSLDAHHEDDAPSGSSRTRLELKPQLLTREGSTPGGKRL